MSTCASSSSKLCYNTECKELKPERPRKGWRLRTGDFAELCDRCFSAYENGRFCDTFHKNASGWRPCESCGKGVHCGCIVSHQLQAFAVLDPGGIECSSCARKNVFLLAGSGPVPWRAAPSYFGSSVITPEMGPRLPYEVVDVSCALNKLTGTPEKITRNTEELSERLQNGGLKLVNGCAAKTCEEPVSSCLSVPSCVKEDFSSPQFGLSTPYASTNETITQNGLSGASLMPTPPSFPKQFSANSYSGVDSCETQIRNARPRAADARGKTQLLPRYWPRFTDQELQQISGDSNSVITPLFEKMLSASDAGRIGRLVLPKKCAEAYFPPISQPEGLPLKVQDARGKEWIFQFRFWPNNNSRMYVLEGVTPCIQSMQLQAGDIVTFSRMEPEGKLVMGFRKASAAPPSDQENEISKNSNGVPTRGDAELADPSCWSKVDKSGYIAKEAVGVKAMVPRKRKSSTLGSKSKRLRIENEDMMELKLTWQEAQGLLRPPTNHLPSIVVIEGFEFEEYEDAPVVGKPTIFSTNNAGETIQWIQCEDCFKFRKLPADALLSSKWTCSDNSWDPERAFCSAAPELNMEELEDLLPNSLSAGSKKMKSAKQESEMENLDTLANLAILGEQTTTKHPRHRPGCSCIVCIQPPSGKGPKHKQTCTCSVCSTVKRRFRTLMERREKKQSEKYAETTRKKPAPDPSPELSPEKLPTHEASDEEPSKAKPSSSPFKGRIDLNIQPEREEELSPVSDSGGGVLKLIHDATERYLKQREIPDPPVDEVSNGVDCPETLTVKPSVSSTAVG